MRSTYVSWSTLASVMLCTAAGVCAEDDIKVLENLVNYDSVFESGFTVSSKRYTADDLVRGRLFIDVTRRWRLCFEGDRVGYIMEAIDYEKPKYVQLKGMEPGETLSLSVRTKQWGYWGHDLSGNHYEDTVLAITTQGDVTETGKMYNSSVFGPRDEGPVAPKRVALWSLGRFFSKQLDEVIKAEKSSDGRLSVTAKGRKDDQVFGRWELEIEPDAAWMVREARFHRDKTPDLIDVEMKNSGTTWSGAYCIPQTAEINHWGPIGEGKDGTERLEFEPLIEKFDERLYSDAKQAVAENRAPSLALHDYRVSPPTITEPSRPIPATAPLQATPGTNFKVWLFVANLLVAFALLVYFLAKKLRKPPEGGANK